MKKIVIIGAGPAGLGVGYEITTKKGPQQLSLSIVDKNERVGGLARTYYFKGHYFDIGPHRFYTRNTEVLSLWKKVLGKEFVPVKRLTRILYKNHLFLYPIKLTDILKKLGPKDSLLSGISFFQAKMTLSGTNPKTFEDWVTKNFGKKLYTIFFKTYTEKVWGIPCNKIGAEWAAQRIKNLNFTEVVKTAIVGSKKSKAKSLINTFHYPTRGAGYAYEKMAKGIEKAGGKIKPNTEVKIITHVGRKIVKIDKTPVDFLFSSMPLTHFIFALYPKPPKRVLDAAKKLYYRDHITVNFVVKGGDLFPDNWIYVHSPEVKMARVTNYNNFSRTVKKVPTSALSVEYFVFQKDSTWKLSNKELFALAEKELRQVELIEKRHVIIDGFVVRETESYPTYYTGHKKYFDILKEYVEGYSNLQTIGRGGLYKYNNMDHSIYSGILAARNYLKDDKHYNIWKINEDATYLEAS